MTNIDTALVERARELLVTELRCDGAHLLAGMIENLNDGAILSNPPTSSAIRAIVAALQSTREKEAREALEMAHALIQEAKGAEGPSGGFVTNHLDAAEHWLDKVEAALSNGERETLPVGGEEERARTGSFMVAEEEDGLMALKVSVASLIYVEQGDGLLVMSHSQARELARILTGKAPAQQPAVGEEGG